MVIRSLLTIQEALHSLDEIRLWIENRNRSIHVSISPVPFSSLDHWSQEAIRGKDQQREHSFLVDRHIPIGWIATYLFMRSPHTYLEDRHIAIWRIAKL